MIIFVSCPDCVDTLVCHICGGKGSSSASGVPTRCPACAGSGTCATCGKPSAPGAGRRHDGAPNAAEAGTVGGSPLIHAVAKTLTGNKARCGAGLIVGAVTGRFDPEADGSCRDCAQR